MTVPYSNVLQRTAAGHRDWDRRLLGMFLLANWLIASGAMLFVHINFAHTLLMLAALAIAAGVLLLLCR